MSEKVKLKLVQMENDHLDPEWSFGEKLADKIADFGGSWTFLILFFSFLFIWIGTNIFILTTHPLDPYPFIFLNLLLSCIAAIQAPIIMMSQNRQELKDRLRAQYDYNVNLQAELEIRQLHEKIDALSKAHIHHLAILTRIETYFSKKDPKI